MTTLIEACREKEVESIEIQVGRAVRLQTGGLIRGLDITMENDHILITGSTDLFYHKQLATRAAMETVGDKLLQNEIEVCSS